MGTAIKHPMPDRVKQSFVIFDIRTCGHSDAHGSDGWASECPDVRFIAVPIWQQWASKG